MANQPTPPNRRSVRIPEYDYAIEGSYFVTVCTHGKTCTLGRLVHAHIELSPLGELVRDCWQQIPDHFDAVTLDEYVIMPNHLHGIVVKWSDTGTACRAPTDPRDPGVAFTPIVKEGRTQEVRSTRRSLARDDHQIIQVRCHQSRQTTTALAKQASLAARLL